MVIYGGEARSREDTLKFLKEMAMNDREFAFHLLGCCFADFSQETKMLTRMTSAALLDHCRFGFGKGSPEQHMAIISFIRTLNNGMYKFPGTQTQS